MDSTQQKVYASSGSSFSLVNFGSTPAATADGLYIQGADGNVYQADGTKLTSPAGVKLGPLSASQNYGSSWRLLAAGDDGRIYSYSYGSSTFQIVKSSGQLTAQSVSFGGTAAASFSQSGSTITATTPAHVRGAVDVVVTTTSGATFTLPGAFTYLGVSAKWRVIDATAAKNPLAGSSWTLTPVDGSGNPTGAQPR